MLTPLAVLLSTPCATALRPAGIERRIANWSHLPVHHGEGLQVLRYQRAQKYEAHWGERLAGAVVADGRWGGAYG